MRFHIPLTFSSIGNLKARSKFFLSKIKYKKGTKLEENLINSDLDISREEYLAICLRTLVFSFIIFLVLLTTVFALLGIRFFYLFGILAAVGFSFFVFFSQAAYPFIYVSKRQKNIERNLIPALSA